MSVRETHSLGGKPVHVRRRNFAALGVIGLHVSIAKVVGQDDEYVGAMRGGERPVAQKKCEQAAQ